MQEFIIITMLPSNCNDLKSMVEGVLVVCFKEISASADGGPRSHVRARGTLRLAPHRH